jgi:hypothetical protein
VSHLKHSGPIRQAAHAKRTALIEVFNSDDAANEGDLSEADLLEIDRSFEARKDADCASFGQHSADRAQAVELARQPNQGFIHG